MDRSVAISQEIRQQILQRVITVLERAERDGFVDENLADSSIAAIHNSLRNIAGSDIHTAMRRCRRLYDALACCVGLWDAYGVEGMDAPYSREFYDSLRKLQTELQTHSYNMAQEIVAQWRPLGTPPGASRGLSL